MNLRDGIGIAVVLAFVAVTFNLFFLVIPPENKDLLTYIIGQLSGFAGGVIAYHYTASKSDDRKTENTGKAFDAISAAVAERNQAPAGTTPVVVEAPARVEVIPGDQP